MSKDSGIFIVLAVLLLIVAIDPLLLCWALWLTLRIDLLVTLICWYAGAFLLATLLCVVYLLKDDAPQQQPQIRKVWRQT